MKGEKLKTTSLTLLLAVLVLSSCLLAEGEKAVSGGLELALPTGDFGDVAGTGFGATGKFLYQFKPDIKITGTTGYIMWTEKESAAFSYKYSVIPLKGGVRYYFTPNLYAVGELGIHIYMFSFEYQDYWTGQKVSDSDSDTEFGFAPGAGYEMPINENLDLDISLRYEIGDLDYLAFRVGLNFPLK